MIDTIFSKHENQISISPLADKGVGLWVESFEQPGVTLRCQTAGGYVKQIEVFAQMDGMLVLQNKFATQLIAISDDVKVERFDDMIQKVINCDNDSFFPLALVKDRTYQISAIY